MGGGGGVRFHEDIALNNFNDQPDDCGNSTDEEEEA